jgi:subtilisin family serine protease
MQHVAPLAPLLLAAAFVASIGASAAAPAGAIEASVGTANLAGRAAADRSTITDAPGRGAEADRDVDAGRGLSAAGRWIVLLRDGSSVNGAETRARRLGVSVDRTFRNAVRGYSARLSDAQVAALREDPTVEAVVPDAVISMTAQSTPRGVRRVFATQNPISRIDGIDQRVDADVAIVDTGIDKDHGDLNVVGGVNCSSTNRSAWDDGNGHGTHVAGIVGAVDNGTGVVGVAPGVRLWAVRILNSSGAGLVSWYVCGLDWITAQRDPSDPSRPLIEAANMSVAKSGKDDHNCGMSNSDPMHRAVCRLVGSGVTVVAAAGNNHFNAARLVPASYNEVITVSALADSDGRPGALGGKACYSWGSYDKDDTFANFSNYGGDVDLIAPGKCILSTVPGGYGFLSGTSMAAPHVTAAAALYKASRPTATPSQVRSALRSFGNHDWKQATDPDGTHEPLLDVGRIVLLGDFAMSAPSPSTVLGPAGGTFRVRVEAIRAEDVPDPIRLSVHADSPLGASLSDTLLSGFSDSTSQLTIHVPAGTGTGTYFVDVTGAIGGTTHTARVAIVVDTIAPTIGRPWLGIGSSNPLSGGKFTARAAWPAGKDSTTAIAGYQVRWSVDGGAWGPTTSVGSGARSAGHGFVVGHSYRVQVRARDAAGNWSGWSQAGPFEADLVQDSSTSLTKSGTWRVSRSGSWSGGTTRFTKGQGASIGRSFTGRGIALVAPRGPKRGAARIYIDGNLAHTIHEHARHLHPRRILFTRTWKTTATHSIRVVGLATPHQRRIDVDAFVILR